MKLEIEDQLKNDLRERAGDLPTRSDPYALVHGRIVRSARRRTGALVVCTVVLLVTAALAVPGLLGIGDRNQPVNRPSPRVDGSSGSPMQWPARGSLAGDDAYVQQAAGWLAQARSTMTHRLKASDINVLYVGDVGGKRLAIGASYQEQATEGSGREIQVASLSGPEGSTAELTDRSSDSTRIEPNPRMYVIALPSDNGRRGTVVVLAGRSVDRLRFSRSPIIHPSGTITRTWEPLIDEDSEPGLVTSTIELAGVGSFRVAASSSDGTVIEDQAAGFYSSASGPPDPDRRLRQLAEDAVGDQPVPGLAETLASLESQDVGRGAIKRVEVPWRFHEDEDWVGLVIELDQGGVVEAVYKGVSSNDPSGRNPPPVIYALRAVPADQVQTEALVWWNESPDICKAYGYVPDAEALEVASVRVQLNGKWTDRMPTNGAPIIVDSCVPSDNPEIVQDSQIEVFDTKGRTVWSGGLAGKFRTFPRTLDVPSTVGRPN